MIRNCGRGSSSCCCILQISSTNHHYHHYYYNHHHHRIVQQQQQHRMQQQRTLQDYKNRVGNYCYSTHQSKAAIIQHYRYYSTSGYKAIIHLLLSKSLNVTNSIATIRGCNTRICLLDVTTTRKRQQLQQQLRMRYYQTKWSPLLSSTHTDESTTSEQQQQEQHDILNNVPSTTYDDNETDIIQMEQQHGYVEAPDSGPRICQLNDQQIHQLLLDRTKYMLLVHLTQVRRIDEIFEQNNIYIDDIAKQWRADGKQFTTYLRHNSDPTKATTTATTNNNNNNNNNNSDNQLNQQDDEERNIEEDRKEYRLFPYTGPKMKFITELEIHTLLLERSTYRRKKEFDKADRIRKTLESYGVFIDDRNKIWKDQSTNGSGYKVSLQKHNYTMSKDSGPIKSNITEDAIHDLLNKRFRCRLRKDYLGAQRILEKLNNCNVSIDEELLEWRADGVQFSKFLRRHEYKLAYDSIGPDTVSSTTLSDTEKHNLLSKHWSYQQKGDIKNADKIWQELSDAGIFLDVTAMEWRADGIKHNYRLSPDAGPNISKLSDKNIHALLEKRMLSRWKKDFVTSDRIRNRLKSDGIYIDDDKKEWRADGKRYEQHTHQYNQVPNSGPIISTLSENQIHALLSELWNMKLTQDYKEADRISEELINAGVYVNDKTVQWRADGMTCNYTLFDGAGPYKGTMDEIQVHRMLEKSFRLRLRKSFDEANVIHNTLMNAGVFIEQDKNLWRGDGIMHSYKLTSKAGPNTSLLLVNDIHNLIAERWRYKVTNEFENADRIYVELRDNGVHVDDESMEWRADGIYHTYQLCIDSGPNISSLSESEIHRLLGRRQHHKKFQNFHRADQILDYLRTAKVYVNDSTREWRADGNRFPPIKRRTINNEHQQVHRQANKSPRSLGRLKT